MMNSMNVAITACLVAGTVTARIGSGVGPDALIAEEQTRSLASECWKKKWSWPNDYCESKPMSDCQDWEIVEATTWDQCCLVHCKGTGLTKNKPGPSSPTLVPVDSLTTSEPTSSPSSEPIVAASPTAQPIPSPEPPVGDRCWKKQWSWPNDYCESKPLLDCPEWEFPQATTWEQCCAGGHCKGTGLTKNKPGPSSPPPIDSFPTSGPSSLPSPIAPPTGQCTAVGETCTFEPGAGISAWFTQALFDEMFPNLCASGCEDACRMLTYPCLIQATLAYPTFANSGNSDDDMRELAGWLGIMGQETTGGGCQPPGVQNSDGSCSCSGPSWCDSQPNGGCSRWGLCKVLEAGGTYCSPGGLYPCVNGKSYRGRGPKQLSWNYNYGQFSKEYCGDQNILLQNPDWVATNPTLAWASSIWFWYSGGACDEAGGEQCKPSPHSVFTGAQKLCSSDTAANRKVGLGWAINIVNGGLECGGGSSAGKCDYRVYSRVRFYRHYCSILGVVPLADGWTDDDNLFCGNMENYSESPPLRC